MEIKPGISVVMCTYNGANWLPAQLDSIVSQQMPVNEIVVCDDHSTDATWDILSEYDQKYPGVFRLLKNAENLGAIRNFAQAILLAKGDLIFLSDQDDIWLADKVEKMVALFKSNPWANAIATDGFLISEGGEKFNQSFWQQLQFDFPPFVNGQQTAMLASFLLTQGNVACGAMLAFRKQPIIPFFQLPVPVELFHDYWIAIIAAMKQSLLLTDIKTTFYRLHAAQTLGIEPIQPRVNHLPDQSLSHQNLVQIAFGLGKLEKLIPILYAQDKGMEPLISALKAQMIQSLSLAKKDYFQHFTWFPRKVRLIKHWLKGGEYLRISFRDLLWI